MRNFCNDLKEHATKVIDYKKKLKILPLREEENKSYNK